MKRVIALSVFLTAARCFAAMPPLLDEAIKKWIAEEDHWAYTQRVQYKMPLGRGNHNRVERFDPSLPDEEQWKLLLIDGKTPSESDISSWKRQKKREMQRRERPLADYFDLERATVAEDMGDAVRFDVPLQKERYRRVPLEKVAVSILVNKKERALVSLVAGLKESFRVGFGVAKVTGGDLEIRFKTVDSQYPPQPEYIRAVGAGRIAFVFKIGGDADVNWTDFTRVTPYKARFDVQIGELRALGF